MPIIKNKDKQTKWNTIFKAFGISGGKAKNLKKKYKNKGFQPKDVYRNLAKKTGKKPGGGFLTWATSGGRSNIFNKAEKKYERKFGTPGEDRLTEVEKEGQQAADKYYAPDKDISQDYIDEANRRLEEDYNIAAGELKRPFDYTQEDIARNRAIADRDYQQRLGDITLQTQLENEGLTADVNAAGQYDSSLRRKRFGRLRQQQGSRLTGVNNNYNDYISGLDITGNRAQEGYDYNLGQYQRNRDRGMFDIDALERQRELDFERSQQDYSTNYLGNELDDIAQESQTYYDRQAQNDNQAAQYIQDYNTVTS